MAHIDYFMITLSPFAYLAGNQLEEIAAKHGAEITYKPFNLIKVFEEHGTALPAKRHPSRQAYRLQELARASRQTGLSVNAQPAYWPTNPVPSCSAIIAAQNAGGGDLGGLTHALLRACWAEEKDISQDDVVIACLEANGFDGGLLNSGMLSGAETYGANTEEALKRGVFGSPFYIVDEQLFWGHDRLAALDDFLSEES